MVVVIHLFFIGKFYLIIAISIYASKKEATCSSSGGVKISSLFQSSPPRKRRPVCETAKHRFFIFQSTPPRRRRRPSCSGRRIAVSISIHASEKEATFHNLASQSTTRFQSTPPRRRRPKLVVAPAPNL